MKKVTLVGILFVWLLLAACNQTEPATTTITYQRSGGFAGVMEEYTIQSDGTVATKDGRTFQVEAAQVAQLVEDIEALGFFDLTGDYLPDDTCCDRFEYILTVTKGDQSNTVMTVDAAEEAPAELFQIIDKVNAFIATLPASS
ncbi:MAG: protealysin inhibitor emfourin [Chloroflexota bacterium]